MGASWAWSWRDHQRDERADFRRSRQADHRRRPGDPIAPRASSKRWRFALWRKHADGEPPGSIAILPRDETSKPISGASVKLTTEGGKVILALPERGRALVRRVPEPVQIELKKLSVRGAHVCREIFAGILVVGLVAIVLGYGRLGRGPISLASLVPTIEAAINGELTDLHVKIDDAILQRAPDGPGVLFRLRNIRLIDKDGAILAQSPLAAIGMSGSALLSGRLAPGSVDFIGPRLVLLYDPVQGLALSFSRPTADDTEASIRGSLPAGDSVEQANRSPGCHHRQAPGTCQRRPGARRDAHGRRSLRAGAQRQYLLLDPVRRQGRPRGAQSERHADLLAGAGLLHRSRAQRSSQRAHRPSQYRLRQRRLATRVPHRAANQAEEPRRHGADSRISFPRGSPATSPRSACSRRSIWW